MSHRSVISRPYSTSDSSVPKDDEPQAEQPRQAESEDAFDSLPPTPTPEIYLKVLEGDAYAPWLPLEHTANDKATPKDRLARAYTRIWTIFMYLGRPQDEQAASQFLHVRPMSNIGRLLEY